MKTPRGKYLTNIYSWEQLVNTKQIFLFVKICLSLVDLKMNVITAGIGWSAASRRVLSTLTYNGTLLNACQFTLKFTFASELDMFPRLYNDPDKPNLQLKNYAEFAIFSRDDTGFQVLPVITSSNDLDYNFFCEQYSKVSSII